MKKQINDICSVLAYQLQNAPWEDPQFYAQWLAQTAHFVSHSTRLLALCAAHCGPDQGPLHNRFIAHAAEEKGHEKLAAMDLKSMGYRMEQFKEHNATMSLYQPQYYWIQFKGPVSFFGYIFCLEMIAKEAGPVVYPKVKAAYGERACHFVRVHTEEDEDHVEKAFAMLEQFSDDEKEMILQNLSQSCENYGQLLASCQSERSPHRKSA